MKCGNSFPMKYFLPARDTGVDPVMGLANSFNKYFSEVGEKRRSEFFLWLYRL